MSKTTPKLSKLSWLQRWNNYWKKPIPLKIQTAHETIINTYNQLEPTKQNFINEEFQNYQKNWEQYSSYLSETELEILINLSQLIFLQELMILKTAPKIDAKKIYQIMVDQHEKFMNWYHKLSWHHQKLLSIAMNNYLTGLNNELKKLENNANNDLFDERSILSLIMILQETIQKIIEENIQSWNATSPENIALRYFQNTQAPSDIHVPIIHPKDKDLKPKEALEGARYLIGHIMIGKDFQDTPPAKQYMFILHEYRHHLQHLNNAIPENKSLTNLKQQKFYSKKMLQKAKEQANNPEWLIYEHDADHFATEHITCPTCLKIIQTIHNSDKNPQGYFNHEDIEPFVKAAANNPCCPAHTKIPGDDQHNFIVQQLEEKLTMFHPYRMSMLDTLFLSSEFSKLELKYYEKDFKEIQELDKQSGNLLQHIPNYNRDFIRGIAQQKEFQKLLGTKLLKELDVRQTMAKTEQQSQKGDFPLIQEHKLKPIV